MDFSWSELMVVGIVALIVIGPKDLPGMFRELGRFTAKIRAMGREFSRAMDQAAKDSGVKDVAEDLKKATSAKAMGLDAVKSAADKFEKWDPLKNAAKPTTPPAAKAPAAAAAAATTPAAADPTAKPAAAAAAVGPETAALAEKQAARKAAA
ncbi:MAG: Sec-independent protein translocase protein TatB, partial [Paracoccaceae bacterium]